MDNIKQIYVVSENQQHNYVFVIDKDAVARTRHFHFVVCRNAHLGVELFIADGDASITIECIIHEGAHARIAGAYSGTAAHTITITTLQHHQGNHSSSVLLMKGALYDAAKVHYSGTIRIEKNARGSHASQENKNILLSKQARAVSVPNLEVLTHDVTCFHGSAIGNIDTEQLFYATTRGIDEKTAQRMLVKAFFADVFEDEDLKNMVKNLFIPHENCSNSRSS